MESQDVFSTIRGGTRPVTAGWTTSSTMVSENHNVPRLSNGQHLRVGNDCRRATNENGRSDEPFFKPMMRIRFRAERLDFDVSTLPV